MIIQKSFIEIEGTQVERTVRYDKGGMNYFNHRQEPRGYSIHMQPGSGNGLVWQYVPTDGIRLFLLEVKRQSKNKDKEAIQLAKQKEYLLIEELTKTLKNKKSSLNSSTLQ